MRRDHPRTRRLRGDRIGRQRRRARRGTSSRPGAIILDPHAPDLNSETRVVDDRTMYPSLDIPHGIVRRQDAGCLAVRAAGGRTELENPGPDSPRAQRPHRMVVCRQAPYQPLHDAEGRSKRFDSRCGNVYGA